VLAVCVAVAFGQAEAGTILEERGADFFGIVGTVGGFIEATLDGTSTDRRVIVKCHATCWIFAKWGRREATAVDRARFAFFHFLGGFQALSTF
jgi:hypothetical protein